MRQPKYKAVLEALDEFGYTTAPVELYIEMAYKSETAGAFANAIVDHHAELEENIDEDESSDFAYNVWRRLTDEG